MLDIKFIRENPERIKAGARDKNFSVDIDQLLALDDEIRPLKKELEDTQARRNALAKEIPAAGPDTREGLKREAVEIKGRIEGFQTHLNAKTEAFDQLMLLVPQPADDDVPKGRDDKENVEIRKVGTPRSFEFKPVDHMTLGERLGIVDAARGVKLAGSRSYVLKGQGAILEQAILRFTYDRLVRKGYMPMSVPLLVEEHVMQGTGYFPLGRDQAYFIEKDKLALIGTSEVPLCAFHGGDTLSEDDLPLRMMAQSHCFRREAGTYGKDTRGLYRVHQFQKIEMVVLAPADKAISRAIHDELLGNAEEILQAFEIPYRVVYVCTGDLGQGQVRKHDIEAWMPSRESYGETHSCSTFYDFQARRLQIRYKDKDGNRRLAYTLNNTAVATPRVLIPLLENHQTRDGRVRIPTALRPYMDGAEFIG